MKETDFNEVIKIDKNNLDENLMEQASIFFKISSELAQAISLRDELYDKSKRVAADMDKLVRDHFAQSGTKATEAIVQAEILTRGPYIKAREEFNNAKLEADILLAQKEAFIQRSYMLREMCQLFISGYFTDSAMKANSEVVAQFGTNKARQKMKAVREERSSSTPRRKISK